MIDFKLLSIIGVTIILSIDISRGQYRPNRYSDSQSSPFRRLLKSSTPRNHYVDSNSDLQFEASNFETAESDSEDAYHHSDNDLLASPGHHHHSGHGGHGYFQYIRVPHPYAWEFGYRKGNPWHFREHHEQGHGPQFKAKLRWGDKHGGYGEHYWDYNHVDRSHSHHG